MQATKKATLKTAEQNYTSEHKIVDMVCGFMCVCVFIELCNLRRAKKAKRERFCVKQMHYE